MTRGAMHRPEKLTCIRCRQKFTPKDETSPVFLCEGCRGKVRKLVEALVRNEIRKHRKVGASV